jgi:large subunit ribosomal protein L22
MEARSINRYIGSSPRKMRLVIDLIRGKSVDEALHILHFSPKHASKVAEKVLRSAVSNLQNQDGAGRLEAEQMFVRAASVDVGMTMKRVNPAPMGRAYRIRKRSHHLTIVVAAKETPLPAEKVRHTKRAEAKVAKGQEEAPAKGTAKKSAGPKKRADAGETK